MAASSQTPTPGLAFDSTGVKAGDSSIDQALTLLLADETEAALRWGAAALQRDPSTSSALVVTSRLLERMGRTRAAVEGLDAAVALALEAGNLPLAIAAIDELRALGEHVGDWLDRVSETFCDGSPRLDATEPPLSPHFDDFQPLSSFLAGPALASKAAQIVHTATSATTTAPTEALPPVARLPLFSALPKDALRDLLAAFDVVTVPAGYRVMEEGEPGAAAYIVARGEIVLRRSSGAKPPVVLARLGSGAFFGEMALLSDMPRVASAVAVRPSILLVATREAMDAVARRHPSVAVELATHCHRRLVANLGRMAPILVALPPVERAAIVEKFETRIFRKGERLANKGEEVAGLHLLASGSVAIVAHDGSERFVLATLSAGETIGEVELVLCRKANADAIALQPTVTLFLSRESFASLLVDYPALLQGLYVSAIRRDGETVQAMESAAFTASEYQLDDVVVEEPTAPEETRYDIPAITVPPALPAIVTAEPASGVTVTAPFPPVWIAPPPVETLGNAEASTISPLVAPASPAMSTPPKTGRPSLFSKVPPVVLLGAFGLVAMVAFALAASWNGPVDTASASGGNLQGPSTQAEAQPTGDPSERPTVEPAPTPPSSVAVTSPPSPSSPSAAPIPTQKARPVASARPHTASTRTVDPPLSSPTPSGPTPTSSAVATTASKKEPRTASVPAPTADDFGGRE